jgi:hypothetical protein
MGPWPLRHKPCEATALGPGGLCAGIFQPTGCSVFHEMARPGSVPALERVSRNRGDTPCRPCRKGSGPLSAFRCRGPPSAIGPLAGRPRQHTVPRVGVAAAWCPVTPLTTLVGCHWTASSWLTNYWSLVFLVPTMRQGEAEKPWFKISFSIHGRDEAWALRPGIAGNREPGFFSGSASDPLAVLVYSWGALGPPSWRTPLFFRLDYSPQRHREHREKYRREKINCR